MIRYKVYVIAKYGKDNLYFNTKEEAIKEMNEINTLAEKARKRGCQALASLVYRWAGMPEKIIV